MNRERLGTGADRDENGPAARTLQGLAASPGIAMGTVATITEPEFDVEAHEIVDEQVDAEVQRFHRAIEEVTREISDIRDAMETELGTEGAAIFDAHLMILRDPLVIDNTVAEVRGERKNAEFLFRQNMLRVLERFDSMEGGLFKERAADIRDVKYRVLRRLGGATISSPPPQGGEIVAARELA